MNSSQIVHRGSTYESVYGRMPGVGERWSEIKAGRLAAVLVRECGTPIRQNGSHRIFRRVDGTGTFTFAVHDRKTIPGSLELRILTRDAGMTDEQARKAVRG